MLDAFGIHFARRRTPPPPALKQTALAVAAAISELAVASGAFAPNTSEPGVALDIADIAERTGYTAADVQRGLGILAEIGIVEFVAGHRAALAQQAISEYPVVAEIRWDLVRRALSTGRVVGFAAQLAVLRAIAAFAGADRDGWISETVDDVSAATTFSRSAVNQALERLQSTGLIERQRRGRRTDTRLTQRCFEGDTASADDARGKDAPAPTAFPSNAGTGVIVDLEGALIGIPAGSVFDPPEGYVLIAATVGPDGRPIMRFEKPSAM